MVAFIKSIILKILIYFMPDPASAPEGTETVTRKGINRIMIRLFLSMILGGLLTVLIHSLKNIGIGGNTITLKSTVFTQATSFDPLESLVLVLFAIYIVIMPFLRYIYKWLRVTGVIYAMAFGYTLASVGQWIKLSYMETLIISMSLSLLLCMLPYWLYTQRIVRLPSKLASVTYVAFVFMTLGGSVMKLFNQIPFIGIVTGKISQISTHIIFRIFADGINIVIAFLFIFLAFDRTSDYIKRRVSRKYEWLAAFTIYYTAIHIVGRINDMLLLIQVK